MGMNLGRVVCQRESRALCGDEYLDATPENIDESLPLKVFGEIVKPIPFASQSFRAVGILTFFDFAGSIITGRRCVTKRIQ